MQLRQSLHAELTGLALIRTDELFFESTVAYLSQSDWLGNCCQPIYIYMLFK